MILWSSESRPLSVSVLILHHICKEIWFKLNLNKFFYCTLAQLGLNNFVFTMNKNTGKDSRPFSTDNHVKLSVVLYLNLACPHKFKMPDSMCIETIARLPFTWLEIELGSVQIKAARLNFQMWIWSTFKERPAKQTQLYQILRDPQVNENKWKMCSLHVTDQFPPMFAENRQTCLGINKQLGQAHLKSKPSSVDSGQVHVCLSRA